MPNERIAESARQAQSDFEAAARKADKCEEGLAAQFLRIFAGACGVEATCAEYDDAPSASTSDEPEWERMSVGYCKQCKGAHALVDGLCYDCRQPPDASAPTVQERMDKREPFYIAVNGVPSVLVS